MTELTPKVFLLPFALRLQLMSTITIYVHTNYSTSNASSSFCALGGRIVEKPPQAQSSQ